VVEPPFKRRKYSEERKGRESVISKRGKLRLSEEKMRE
jgi:hypothetical protein